MNLLFTIRYWWFFYLRQQQRLILLLQSVYSNFCCLSLQKLNTIVLGFIPLEFLSYCFVLTLALVIQKAFYREINLIWFSDNTTQYWAQNWSSWLAHIFFSTPFFLPYSSLPHTIKAVPCSMSSHFIHWQEQHRALSPAQGLKDENTCGIHGAPEQVEKGQFGHPVFNFHAVF